MIFILHFKCLKGFDLVICVVTLLRQKYCYKLCYGVLKLKIFFGYVNKSSVQLITEMFVPQSCRKIKYWYNIFGMLMNFFFKSSKSKSFQLGQTRLLIGDGEQLQRGLNLRRPNGSLPRTGS